MTLGKGGPALRWHPWTWLVLYVFLVALHRRRHSHHLFRHAVRFQLVPVTCRTDCQLGLDLGHRPELGYGHINTARLTHIAAIQQPLDSSFTGAGLQDL